MILTTRKQEYGCSRLYSFNDLRDDTPYCTIINMNTGNLQIMIIYHSFPTNVHKKDNNTNILGYNYVSFNSKASESVREISKKICENEQQITKLNLGKH